MRSAFTYLALFSWFLTTHAAQAEEKATLLNPTLTCTIRTYDSTNNSFSAKQADLVQTRSHVEKLVSGLRQALFRGDISSTPGEQDSTFFAAEIENTLESCAGAPNPYTTSNGRPTFVCQDQEKGFSKSLLNKANYSTIFQVCDHECHLQLARFHVFMSSDFLFLRGNEKQNANADAVAKQHARLCAEPLLDRAIDMNARLLAASEAKEPVRPTGDAAQDKKAKENSVSLFASRNFDLQLLRLKALMASGDIDYQNVSGIQILNQMGRVASSLSGSKVSAKDQALLLQTAYAAYDSARWAIIEIRTEIPKTETDMISTLNDMDDQIRMRIRSVEQGKLFLDLDPEEFSSLSMDTLRSQVMEVQKKIEAVQEKVDELVAEGISKKAELKLLAEDEYRVGSNYQLSIKSEQIAQQQVLLDKRRSTIESAMVGLEQKILQDKAKKLDLTDKSNTLQESIDLWNKEIADLKTGIGRLNATSTKTDESIADLQAQLEAKRKDLENLNHQSELIGANEQLSRAQFELARTKKQFEIEQRQINALGEQELIALSRDKAANLQSHYQWLINLTMTKLNLDMQYKSLGGQITNSATRFKSSGLTALAKQAEYKTLKSDYTILKMSLDISENNIRQLYLKKYFDSAFRQRDLRAKVCEYERQLAFMEATPRDRYASRTLAGFTPGVEQTFPVAPGEAQKFSNAFILYDGARDAIIGENQDSCFNRRFGSNGLFSAEKADISNFDKLFDVDLKDVKRLDPAVNDEQFPLFGYYKLPADYQPDVAGLNFTKDPYAQQDAADGTVIASLEKNVSDALEEIKKPCDQPVVTQTYKQYQEAMCGNKEGKIGLRQTFNQNQEKVSEFIINCVKSEEFDPALCAPLTESEAKLARKIHDQKQESANNRLQKVRELKRLAGEAQVILSGGEATWKAASQAKKAALESIVTSISSAASAISISTTGPCGQGACQLQSIVTDQTIQLQARFEKVKSDADDVLLGVDFWLELTKSINELKTSITEYDMELQKIDNEKTANDLALELTFAEISGSKRQYELQNEVDKISRTIMITDCANDAATLADKTDTLKYQHSQALAEFARENSDRLNVELEISKERSKAVQIYTQMQQINSRIEKLNIEIADLRGQAKDSLLQIENSTVQLCLVDNAKSNVDDFAKKEAVQNDLKQKLADQYEVQAAKINENKAEDSVSLWELSKPYLEKSVENLQSMLGIVGDKRGPLTASQDLQANISVLQIKLKQVQSQIATSSLDIAEREKATEALKAQMNALIEQQTALDKAMVGKETEKSELQSDLATFAGGVADKIISLRDSAEKDIQALVNRVSSPDGKVQTVAGAHDLFSQIFMAVPDYLERKRELIQRGNQYLNKIRSRINILSLVSNTQALPPTGYIRSSVGFDKSLESAFDSIAGKQAEAVIKSASATITIPEGSAFMLDLLEKGQVNFQIAPVVAYGNVNDEDQRLNLVEAKMKEKGYLTLWSPELDFANARIIGVRIATEANCKNDESEAGTVQLVHNGLGSILGVDDSGQNDFARFVSSQARRLQEIPVAHSANIPTKEDKFATWKSLFKPEDGGGLKVWEFEEKRKGAALGLELMGMPVSGSYTLKVDSWKSSCFSDVKKAQLQIHFVISHAGSAS